MKLADQTKLISRLPKDPTVTANSENSLFKNQSRNKLHLHIKGANKIEEDLLGTLYFVGYFFKDTYTQQEPFREHVRPSFHLLPVSENVQNA